MTKKAKLSPECKSKTKHRLIVVLRRGKMIVGKCLSLHNALSVVEDVEKRVGDINLFGKIIDIEDIAEIRFDDDIIYKA